MLCLGDQVFFSLPFVSGWPLLPSVDRCLSVCWRLFARWAGRQMSDESPGEKGAHDAADSKQPITGRGGSCGFRVMT